MRRPCLVCGGLTRAGSRCPAHAVDRGTSWRQAQFRRATLALTGGACARCGAPADHAHHVTPLSEGGHPDGPGEPLCAACHRRAHRPG